MASTDPVPAEPRLEAPAAQLTFPPQRHAGYNREMSEPNGNERDGQPRHYIGLLLGVPLMLFGAWLAASSAEVFQSGRRPLSFEVKLLAIPGIASLAAGCYLIYRAR